MPSSAQALSSPPRTLKSGAERESGGLRIRCCSIHPQTTPARDTLHSFPLALRMASGSLPPHTRAFFAAGFKPRGPRAKALPKCFIEFQTCYDGAGTKVVVMLARVVSPR